jgi:hypothetical protein
MLNKPRIRQALALLVAWGTVVGATHLIDAWFATITQLVAIGWLCTGILVMMARTTAFPLPRGDVIDIRGAFRTLWWASFWPRYLRRK